MERAARRCGAPVAGCRAARDMALADRRRCLCRWLLLVRQGGLIFVFHIGADT